MTTPCNTTESVQSILYQDMMEGDNKNSQESGTPKTFMPVKIS